MRQIVSVLAGMVMILLSACHHSELRRLQPEPIVPKGKPFQEKNFDDSLKADSQWQMFPEAPLPERKK